MLRFVYILSVWLVTDAASAQDAWLVWVERDGAATTYEIEAADAGYRVVGVEPGIHVVVDGERAEIVRSEVRSVRAQCDTPEFPSDAPSVETMDLADELHWSRLDLVGAHGARALVAEPETAFHAFDVEDDLEVLATIGPYVIVRRRLYVHHPCGAHAYGSTSIEWVDLRSGLVVDVVAEASPTAASLRAAAVSLMSEAIANGDVAADPHAVASEAAAAAVSEFLMESPSPPWTLPERIEVASLVPLWSSGAWWAQFRLTLFIGECCESPELLTSERDALPERLANDATPPAPVARFLRRFPQATRLGFSQLH